MNKNIFLIVLLFLVSDRIATQSVTAGAEIDSLQILVEEQVEMQLQAAMGMRQRTVFPVSADMLVRGVETTETAKSGAQYLNDHQRVLVTQGCTVTPFDSALYYIPPMGVKISNKEYKSRALALKVYSMSVGTLHPNQLLGQKTVIEALFAWEDWYGLIGCSSLTLSLLRLFIYLIIRIRDNKPIIHKIEVEPKLPPHQLIVKEIKRIKTEKIWQKRRPKEYYMELTDAFHAYIKNRFGFNILGMTLSETIDKLLEFNDKEAILDLKCSFQTADLAKFTKHDPQMNENDANLINTIDFINETKQPKKENLEPQPTEITITEKRSLHTRILPICGIVSLSVAFIETLVYIGLQLCDLFAQQVFTLII